MGRESQNKEADSWKGRGVFGLFVVQESTYTHAREYRLLGASRLKRLRYEDLLF